METIEIQLSVKQRELLQPLFDEAEAYSIVGELGAVLLQAYPRGKTGYAKGTFIYHDQFKAMKKALHEVIKDIENDHGEFEDPLLLEEPDPLGLEDDIPF